MNRMRLTTIIGVMVTMIAVLVGAQERAGQWGLGLDGGVWKQVSGEHDYSNLDQVVGLQLRRGISPHVSLELGLTYGWTRPARRPVSTTRAAGGPMATV